MNTDKIVTFHAAVVEARRSYDHQRGFMGPVDGRHPALSYCGHVIVVMTGTDQLLTGPSYLGR